MENYFHKKNFTVFHSLNFERRPGVPLLNFEGGSGDLILNLRWVLGPSFPGPNFDWVPGPRVLRSRVWSPVPTFTPCQEICCRIIKVL